MYFLTMFLGLLYIPWTQLSYTILNNIPRILVSNPKPPTPPPTPRPWSQNFETLSLNGVAWENKTIHTPPPSMQGLWRGGEGKLYSPLQVSKMLERPFQAICLDLFCPRYQISLKVFILGAFCIVKTDKIAMFPRITYFYKAKLQGIKVLMRSG